MAKNEQQSLEDHSVEVSEPGHPVGGERSVFQSTSVDSDLTSDPFAEFARILTEVEEASTKPSPSRESGPGDQAVKPSLSDFDYEIDGDALLTTEPEPGPPPGLAEGAEQGSRLEALSQRLDRLEQENAQLRGRLTQWQADFENARRRAEREQEEMRWYLRGELMAQLLPLVDNFDRALAHGMAEAVNEDFVTGIVLIYKQLCDLLERYGVLPIIAVGEIFDPNLHEAVVIEPRPGYEANTVIAEFEKGYTIGARLLRPARVKVAIRNQ